MNKPGYSELDFCIARRGLHAKEFQQLKKMVTAPVEEMVREKAPLSVPAEDYPLVEGQNRYQVNFVNAYHDHHQTFVNYYT